MIRKLLLVLILVLVATLGTVDAQQTALRTSSFNELWLDAIVSIELIGNEGEFQPLGTGFLVETPQQNIALVTAKHVVEPMLDKIDAVTYVLNNIEGDSRQVNDTTLQAAGFADWFLAADHDLAIRFFAWPAGFNGSYIPANALLPKNFLQAGAPILVLGFPLGLRDPEHSKPIVRSGNVARIDPENIIVDGFVFPGNSGGPVIYMPPLKVGRQLESPFINQEKLIGIVSSFIPYQDRAVSQSTGRARVVFEENTGLANVLPVNAVTVLLSRKPVAEIDMRIRSGG